MPVVMCVLGPVLSCYCYAVPGMTHDDGQSVTETCRRSLEFKQYKCFNVLFIKNDNLVQLVGI